MFKGQVEILKNARKKLDKPRWVLAHWFLLILKVSGGSEMVFKRDHYNLTVKIIGPVSHTT